MSPPVDPGITVLESTTRCQSGLVRSAAPICSAALRTYFMENPPSDSEGVGTMMNVASVASTAAPQSSVAERRSRFACDHRGETRFVHRRPAFLNGGDVGRIHVDTHHGVSLMDHHRRHGRPKFS